MGKRKAYEGIVINKPRRPRVPSRRAQLDGSYVDGYIEYPGPDCTDNNQPEASYIPASLPLPPLPEQDFPSTDASQEPEQSRYRAAKERELAKWAEVRDQLLKTATELAAPTSYICRFCGVEESCPIKCEDCGPTVTYCTECCVRHHITPGHNPQQWQEGRYRYEPFQLCNLDSTILKRHDHQDCTTRTLKTFKVFNSAGRLQNWVLTLCQCEAPSCTLLRYGLWGATVADPQTAYATSLLEWLVLFTLEAQVSVEAFCRTVRLKSDLSRCEMNTLYKSLIGQPITEFRNFMYRRGTAKDLCPQLDDGTTCPACPKEEGTQIIALDGNFGLVRKASSGTSLGPPLHGTSMFMDDAATRDYVNTYNDKNTPDEDCSQFKAGNSLRSQTTQSKLDVTGVFGSVCRHEIPRRFLNMTHGERLAYPVLLITELLKEIEGTNVNLKIVYDISCVLVSHLKNSNRDLLAKLTPALDVFHAYGHKTSCQLKYSTRRLSGFGLTDGESVERIWAYLRRFASTTKEMTASRRVDLLTDALLHYTRRKSSDMELALKKKLDSARKSECVAQEGLAAVMEDANVSMDDIKTWATREKEAICREKSPTPTRPGWKQDYATKLQKLKAVRNKILTTNEDDAAVYQSSFAQLDKELRGIERKRKIIRWTETSEEFLNTMREVDWNTRSSLLSKMRSLAYERSFLASLKRKYPDGQKIAAKVAKQLKATNSKLQKTIDTYNAVEWEPTVPTLPNSVQFREASDSAWQHYSCLDPTVLEEERLPRSVQRKGIDHLHLLHRATEEKEMVADEMRNLFAYLQNEYSITGQAIDTIDGNTCSSNGQRAALTSHLMRLEKRIANVYKYFEHNVPELDFPLLPSVCLALYPFQEHEDGDTLSDDETYSSDEEYDNMD